MRSLVHLVKTFIQKLLLSHIMGRTINQGNPVLFGSHWFDFLQQIQGDQGGKTIIRGDGKGLCLEIMDS